MLLIRIPPSSRLTVIFFFFSFFLEYRQINCTGNDRVDKFSFEKMKKKRKRCACFPPYLANEGPWRKSNNRKPLSTATQRDRKTSRTEQIKPAATGNKKELTSNPAASPGSQRQVSLGGRGVGVLVVDGREFRSVARLSKSCPTRCAH